MNTPKTTIPVFTSIPHLIACLIAYEAVKQAQWTSAIRVKVAS
jgi:hypothetical protein